MDKELGYKRLGIGSSGYTKANALTAVKYGGYEVKFWICTTLDSLKMLVTRQIGVNELSGPVGIVNTVDTTYKQSRSYGLFVVIVEMLNLAILLSANLGVMNLLPLPALDGGIPDHRSNQRKACAAGERRVCTFRRDRAVDGAYGVCDV